jgi:putative hydrolase of the HAD superfamily
MDDRIELDDLDAVLLDVGGVFHLPDHDRVADALARLGVVADRDTLDRAHYEGVRALDEMRDAESNVWHAYNRAYARASGVPDHRLDEATETLLDEFGRGGAWIRVIAGSRDALQSIAALGLGLAVVSNADGTVEEQLRVDGICQVGPGAGIPIGYVADSSVVGVSKPDPEIFHVALEALGVVPERAIHVGDTPAADVVGARAAGVRPVLVDPYDLHPEADCTRVASLGALANLLTAGRPTG